MAGLTKYKGGLYRIDLNEPDGTRPCIRLGRIPVKQARRIRDHVEHLRTARIDGGAPPENTSRWLADIDDDLRARLVALGLAAPKVAVRGLTLAELIAEYKARPKWRDKKPTTHRNYELHFTHICAGLGADTLVADVTESDAENLHGYFGEAKSSGGAGLCRASANRFCDTASMLFRFAVRSRWVPANPFDDVRRGVVATTHTAFVDGAVVLRVIDAFHCSQWRLLLAMARWGGLRTPSEPRGLRWSDIDRERERFTVRSPKTEHHGEAHASRVVPLFPELRPFIDDCFDDAEPGELVLPMMQKLDHSAFRSRLDFQLKKMGITPWPRLFHNLRSTRQTELEEIFPTHVVCAWLGNSERIARRHYLQVTESHFEKAQQKAQQNTPVGAGTTGNDN